MPGARTGCQDPNRHPRTGSWESTVGHVTGQMQFWGSDCFSLTSRTPRGGPCTLPVGGSLSEHLRTLGSSECSQHLTRGCHSLTVTLGKQSQG